MLLIYSEFLPKPIIFLNPESNRFCLHILGCVLFAYIYLFFVLLLLIFNIFKHCERIYDDAEYVCDR